VVITLGKTADVMY